MNNYQRKARSAQIERLINLGFVKIQLGMQSPHAINHKVHEEIETAEQENKETDEEMKNYFGCIPSYIQEFLNNGGDAALISDLYQQTNFDVCP